LVWNANLIQLLGST